MRLKLAVLADDSHVDERGKLSIMGVFDYFLAPGFPTKPPPFDIVARFEFEPLDYGKTFKIGVSLLDADGSVLVKITPPDELPVPRENPGRLWLDIPYRTRFHDRLRFPEPGNFAFELAVDGVPVGTIPFRVVSMEERESWGIPI